MEGNTMAKPRIAQAYRLVLLIIILQVLMVGHAYSQSEHVGSIVDNFLIPITVPSGLCSDGSSLWVGDYAITSGSSSIYKIDIWTHQIVDSIPSPGAWDAGLSRTDSAIWEFTDYPTFEDFAPAKLSTSGKILRYFPARNSCYWSGIAWDGKGLYYGTNVCFASPKGQKSMIYKANPATGAVIDSIPPPSGHINGLVFNIGTSGLAFAYWVSTVNSAGVESHVSNGSFGTAWLPLEFKLGQNYPNPFNPTTTIPYDVSTPWVPETHVTITVYDVLGRKVATLVDKDEGPGEKSVVFNASNLPSGVYFYRMRAGSDIETKKCILIK